MDRLTDKRLSEIEAERYIGMHASELGAMARELRERRAAEKAVYASGEEPRVGDVVHSVSAGYYAVVNHIKGHWISGQSSSHTTQSDEQSLRGEGTFHFGATGGKVEGYRLVQRGPTVLTRADCQRINDELVHRYGSWSNVPAIELLRAAGVQVDE